MDDVLFARLERAERLSRLLGTAMVILASCFMLFIGTAAAPSRIVAHTLSIVDPSGHERVLLTTAKDGSPYIHLDDGSGNARVSLYVNSSGYGGVDIRNSKGTIIAKMYEPANWPGGNLAVYDGDGDMRAEIGMAKEGTPALWFYGPGKKVQANMGVSDYGPYLRLQDTSATLRGFLGAYEDGTYGMEIDDSSGSRLWKQP